MSRPIFQTLVTVLYWACNLCIALMVAAVLFMIAMEPLFSGKGGKFYVNDMPFENLNKAIFKVPVSVDVQESLADTTILFRPKNQPASPPELYSVGRPFDADSTLESIRKRQNRRILAHYKTGTNFPTDTIVNVTTVETQNNINPLQITASTPQQLKGFIKINLKNLKNSVVI